MYKAKAIQVKTRKINNQTKKHEIKITKKDDPIESKIAKSQ